MQDLKFLPLTQEAVEQKVAVFLTYSDEIRRSLPDVLLAMMTLLLNQYRAKYVLTLYQGCGLGLVSLKVYQRLGLGS